MGCHGFYIYRVRTVCSIEYTVPVILTTLVENTLVSVWGTPVQQIITVLRAVYLILSSCTRQIFRAPKYKLVDMANI